MVMLQLKTFFLDINECTMGENKCHESAMCSNIAGSYDCICNPGFTGDGFSCVGKPTQFLLHEKKRRVWLLFEHTL